MGSILPESKVPKIVGKRRIDEPTGAGGTEVQDDRNPEKQEVAKVKDFCSNLSPELTKNWPL